MVMDIDKLFIKRPNPEQDLKVFVANIVTLVINDFIVSIFGDTQKRQFGQQLLTRPTYSPTHDAIASIWMGFIVVDLGTNKGSVRPLKQWINIYHYRDKDTNNRDPLGHGCCCSAWDQGKKDESVVTEANVVSKYEVCNNAPTNKQTSSLKQMHTNDRKSTISIPFVIVPTSNICPSAGAACSGGGAAQTTVFESETVGALDPIADRGREILSDYVL